MQWRDFPHRIVGSATLIHGDCREVLPLLPKGSVILTDPVWPNCPSGLIPGSERPDELWRETMRAVRDPKRVVVVMRSDSDPRFLRHVPKRLPFFRTVQLPYVMPGYIGRKLGGDEVGYWYGPPVAFARGRQCIPGRAPAAQPSGRKANGHPCSRAQVHFDWLVNWCADAGETVVDPFMGSGTTAVAAIKRGQPFFGIEIMPEYYEIACARAEQALRQGNLFANERAAS